MRNPLAVLAAAVKPAKTAAKVIVRRVRARFDSAVTTDGNKRHWQNADGLSAGAEASPAVRQILRRRARYEVANNAYARGIVNTLANHTIGTGVRLQMTTKNPGFNAFIEQQFEAWCSAVGLTEKLHTLRKAKCQDGEGFVVFTNNPGLPTKVQMDLKLVEADQMSRPWIDPTFLTMSDGIEYDDAGNPTSYWKLRHHPGDLYILNTPQADRIPAAQVIHYFRAERPGQLRGIPELVPALTLFAQLRRYTQAVLAAAEACADIAMAIYTEAPANGEPDAIEGNGPFDNIEMEKGSATVLPQGWKLGQVKAEQPTTTYAEFKKQVLSEIGRCLDMPLNVVMCDSSGYNYASGRLDHQVYFRAIRVEQEMLERLVLDRVFAAWFQEAVLVEGYLFQGLRQGTPDLSHEWFWDGQEHVDPMKEASAEGERLLNHTTTLRAIYAKQGKDWKEQIEQRAVEVALMKALELEIPTKRAPTPADPNAVPAGASGD